MKSSRDIANDAFWEVSSSNRVVLVTQVRESDANVRLGRIQLEVQIPFASGSRVVPRNFTSLAQNACARDFLVSKFRRRRHEREI